MTDVKIIVMDPMTYENKVLYEYHTTKEILLISPLFKEWFNTVESVGDFIEIGDNGFSGISNLMLFNNTDTHKYLVSINCEMYTHLLGMLHPPLISDVLTYITTKQKPDIQRIHMFEKCLKFLQILS